MINSSRHKGLDRLFNHDDRSKVDPNLLPRVEEILSFLDIAKSPEDLRLPGYNLHKLKGRLAEYWSVKVNRNWRITFRFQGEDAYDVNLSDYH